MQLYWYKMHVVWDVKSLNKSLIEAANRREPNVNVCFVTVERVHSSVNVEIPKESCTCL